MLANVLCSRDRSFELLQLQSQFTKTFYRTKLKEICLLQWDFRSSLSLLFQSGFGCGADSSAGIFAALQLLYTAALQKLLVQLTQRMLGEDHVKILFQLQKFYSAVYRVKAPGSCSSPPCCVYTPLRLGQQLLLGVSKEPFVLSESRPANYLTHLLENYT